MFEGKANKIIVFFIYISIFVNSIVLIKEPAEFYIGYLIFILLLPVFINRYGVPGNLSVVFGLLFVSGLLNIFLGYNTYAFFFKVFFGVLFSYLFYYYVVLESKYNIEKLFQLYLKGCYIVCLIGWCQLISFKLHFKPGYDFGWILNKWGVYDRGDFGICINSIFGEPTYFGATVSAGMFVALYSLVGRKPYYLTRFQSAVIIGAYLLSYSGLAYAAFFLAIIFLFINFGLIRYVLVFVPVLIVSFYFMYKNVTDFRERYDSTISIFSTGKYQIGQTHGSSIILYNNYRVAMENFSRNWLLGTGLGSHSIAFDKYSLMKNEKISGFNQNGADASSMLLRLISETGILGTGFMLFLTFRCFVIRSKIANVQIPDHYWLISGSIIVIILVNLFRQGNYFLNGFPFFIWIYYYNYIAYKNFITSLSDKKTGLVSPDIAPTK